MANLLTSVGIVAATPIFLNARARMYAWVHFIIVLGSHNLSILNIRRTEESYHKLPVMSMSWTGGQTALQVAIRDTLL